MKALITLILAATLSGCSFFQSELDKTNNLKIERDMPTEQNRSFSIAIGARSSNSPSLDETVKTNIGKLLTDEKFAITYLKSSTSEIDLKTAASDSAVDYILMINIPEPSKSDSKNHIVGTSKRMIAKEIRVNANLNLYETSSDKIVASFSASGSAVTKRIQSIEERQFDLSDPATQDAVLALARKVSEELTNIGMFSRAYKSTATENSTNRPPKGEARDASVIIYK